MEETLIVSVLVSIVSGGASGSVLSLIVSGHRDRRQRRRAFVGFLRSWRVEIGNAPRISGDVAMQPDRTFRFHMPQDMGFAAYQNRLPAFHAEIERVRDCFPDTQRLETLAGRLGSLKEQDWKDKPAQNIILEALDDLIAFVSPASCK